MAGPSIVALVQTSDAAPSQWEGQLSDGRWLYVRYRHAELSIGVGGTLDEAIRVSNAVDAEVTGRSPSEASWEDVAPYVLARLVRA